MPARGRWLGMRVGLLVALAWVLGVGCSSQPRVERVAVDSVTDLSGLWNDTDSRLVSQAMIDDALARPWIDDFYRRHRQPPAVIVGTIRNRSHEHISVDTFVSDIERALINSGRVRFVASAEERDQLRAERRDQDLNVTEESRKAMGQELGADYLLSGVISTIVDAVEGQQSRYYQVDLSLISLADNSKVWIGQQKIKKSVRNTKLRP